MCELCSHVARTLILVLTGVSRDISLLNPETKIAIKTNFQPAVLSDPKRNEIFSFEANITHTYETVLPRNQFSLKYASFVFNFLLTGNELNKFFHFGF